MNEVLGDLRVNTESESRDEIYVLTTDDDRLTFLESSHIPVRFVSWNKITNEIIINDTK